MQGLKGTVSIDQVRIKLISHSSRNKVLHDTIADGRNVAKVAHIDIGCWWDKVFYGGWGRRIEYDPLGIDRSTRVPSVLERSTQSDNATRVLHTGIYMQSTSGYRRWGVKKQTVT